MRSLFATRARKGRRHSAALLAGMVPVGVVIALSSAHPAAGQNCPTTIQNSVCDLGTVAVDTSVNGTLYAQSPIGTYDYHQLVFVGDHLDFVPNPSAVDDCGDQGPTIRQILTCSVGAVEGGLGYNFPFPGGSSGTLNQNSSTIPPAAVTFTVTSYTSASCPNSGCSPPVGNQTQPFDPTNAADTFNGLNSAGLFQSTPGVPVEGVDSSSSGTATIDLTAPSACASMPFPQCCSQPGGPCYVGEQTSFSYGVTARFAPILTGRAIGLTLVAPPLPSQDLADTGPVSTTEASDTSASAEAGVLINASVVTLPNPAEASADANAAQVDEASLVKAVAVDAKSTSTCAGSSGTTTIAFLEVGGKVLIDGPTTPAPNTKVPVGGLTVILNEQVRAADAATGSSSLLVNAVHVTLPGSVDLVVSSAESGIKNCF